MVVDMGSGLSMWYVMFWVSGEKSRNTSIRSVVVDYRDKQKAIDRVKAKYGVLECTVEIMSCEVATAKQISGASLVILL